MEVQIYCESYSTSSTTFKEKLYSRYGPGINLEFRNYEKIRIQLAKTLSHLTFLISARDNNIIPNGLRLKTPIPGRRAKKIMEDASKRLVRERINYTRWRKFELNQKAVECLDRIKNRTNKEDYTPILHKIERRFQIVLDQQRTRQDNKLEKLKVTNTASPKNDVIKKTVINLSNTTLTEEQAQVLQKGLNFALTPKQVPTMDIIAATEATVYKLPDTSAEELRWKIKTILEKNTTIKQNLSTGEIKALRELKKATNIKILPADKGNATVILDTIDYEKKLAETLEKGSYTTLKKDPTSSIERRVYNIIKKHKETLSDRTRTNLTPHYSKPPHLYGLPKIHKAGIPLRPIISSRGSPCYALARFLLPILSPLVGKTESFVKNSQHFVELTKNFSLESEDIFVSFDVESLFTNVPVEESIKIIETKLKDDQTLHERTDLSVADIVEMLSCCLKTTYFQFEDTFFQQAEGLPMGSPLSPLIANLFMEEFEGSALNSTGLKPKVWLRYVDDTFIIWNHGKEELEKFFKQLNTMHQKIKFTMEIEEHNKISFLDVLVEKNNLNIATSVYRKPTHTGRYLNFESNHAGSTKIGVAKSLLHRADTHCSTEEARTKERNSIKGTLLQNGYKVSTINKVMNPRKQKIDANKNCDENQHILCIPYIKGIAEEIKRAARKLGVKTVFQTTSTVRSLLGSNKPKNAIPNTKDCIYQIPCQCGESYIGETKRPLNTRIKEHKTHTQRGETTKSGIAEHAWEKKHHMQWDKAKIIRKEQHWYKRKFIEAAYIMTNKDVFSNPSVEIKPVWRKFITKDPSLTITSSPTTCTNKPGTQNITPLTMSHAKHTNIPKTPDHSSQITTHVTCNSNPDTPHGSSRVIKHHYNTRYKNRS